MLASLLRSEPRSVAHSGRRILIAARWPVGGIRTHLGYNYPALLEAGHHCTLIVPEDESFQPLRETLPGADLLGVPVRDRYCPLWRFLRPTITSKRYDLVHAHGMTAAAHASLACLGTSVPLVVTLHEPLRDASFRGVSGCGKRWLLGRILARATALITVSEDSRINLLHYFPNLRRHASRIHVIPNGIDTTHPAGESASEVPTNAVQDLREQLDLDGRTVLIGFLGRFMPEKGFPLLIEAVARLARFGGVPDFHVVAFGSSDYRREYARRIEELDLGDHVTLRDFVPDVRPVLDQLDLVVVPSLWEASSLLAMEAMCAGVPVLGSNCPGLREVLRDTPSQMVETGVASALETGLREALTMPWYEQASAFAPIARERFDVRRSARRLLDLYEHLTDSQPRRDP